MKRPTPCRPGYGASCALCCGSHNYDASPEVIQNLYLKRRDIFKLYTTGYIIRQMRSCRSNLTGSYYPDRAIDDGIIITLPKLYEDGLQCPFVCALDDGTIGCALYPNKDETDARFDCFQSYTCKYFSCPAAEMLSKEEIVYAARLFKDWYYYTLFIHSIELLRQFKKSNPVPDEVPEPIIDDLKQILDGMLHAEKNLHALHSYFT